MEKIIQDLIKKILELSQKNIIKKWILGTSYNGKLKLECSGEIFDKAGKMSLDFNYDMLIDEDAENTLKEKISKIVEDAENYFKAEEL